MVDFQERDTRRGVGDDDGGGDVDGEGADDDAYEPGDDGETVAPDGAESGEEGADVDGEAEIDQVRQQLEREPAGDGGGADAEEAVDNDATSGVAGEEGTAGHGDGGTAHHHHHEHDVESLGAAVVTVSTSRTLADDPSGDHAVEALVEAGHDVVTRELIPDDYDDVQHTIDTLVRRSDVDVVVSTGGTGVSPDDCTVEAVRPLFEKELSGFGELFRDLSRDQIGTRVVATRATAGVADGVPVFCLPGSRDAVALGVEEIVVPEAPHLAGLARQAADTGGVPDTTAEAAGRSDGGHPESGDRDGPTDTTSETDPHPDSAADPDDTSPGSESDSRLRAETEADADADDDTDTATDTDADLGSDDFDPL